MSPKIITVHFEFITLLKSTIFHTLCNATTLFIRNYNLVSKIIVGSLLELEYNISLNKVIVYLSFCFIQKCFQFYNSGLMLTDDENYVPFLKH